MSGEVDDCFNMFSRRPRRSPKEAEEPQPPQELPIAPSIGAEEYDMTHSRRGKTIVFNHVNFSDMPDPRVGSDVDVANIRLQFTALGFDVQVYTDARRVEVMRILKEVASDTDTDIDCLVVIVLTHGKLNELHAYDTSYSSNKLWESFTADRCPALAGKPKLFFIQACRGRNADKGVRVAFATQMDSGPKVSYTIPTWSDFLICNATYEGYFAWRNSDGSTFIKALCRELATYGERKEICQVLTRVNRQVAIGFAAATKNELHNSKQMPNFLSTLTRELYFRPKAKENLV